MKTAIEKALIERGNRLADADKFDSSKAKGWFVAVAEAVRLLSSDETFYAISCNSGLLLGVAEMAEIGVFEDFLDHAEAYLEQGHKFSGVIAGVVFEDTLRRVGKKNGVDHQEVEQIISGLAKSGIFSQAIAKRCEAAAEVRTRATHADWENFNLNDVVACISITREIMSSDLG